MEILLLIIGLAVGAVIGWLVSGMSKSKLANECEQLKATLESSKAETERRLTEKEDSCQKILAAEKENSQSLINEIKANAQEQVAAANEQIEKERKHAEELRNENDKQWNDKFEAMKQEIEKKSTEQLLNKQRELQYTNRTQFDELMKPIKEQFEAFQKSIEEAKNKNELNKKEITTSFENTLKSFQEHQDMTVKHLNEQTERIGNDANNLTKALKGESKTQGDWGEMILETMLENSGLRKDEEYFVQENVKNEDGKNFRPDVVVRFPEGRSVVIDSKVSLTAYTEAVAAEDEATREMKLAEHVNSVKKHVNELAEKDYSHLVNGAIGYVLMFIPNESSYIAAMKQAPTLSSEAYKKHIIIISPSNLMMALQLAYNLWQADRQGKNVEEIVRRAGALYDKVVGFQDSFEDIGNYIGRLTKSFEEAKKKLYEGNANIMRQTESLKELGVTPKKQLKLEE